MKNFFDIESIGMQTKRMVRRFPVPVVCTLMLTLMFWWDMGCSYIDKLPYQMWIFAGYSLVLSLAAVLWLEGSRRRIMVQMVSLAVVVLWGGYCLFLPDKRLMHEAQATDLAVMGAVFLVTPLFIGFLQKGSDMAFWRFALQVIVQGLIAFVFGLILFLGLLLAIGALYVLFDISPDQEALIGRMATLCGTFGVFYLLVKIPDKNKEYQESDSFYNRLKILPLYILTPLLAVYAVILYLYLAKVIVNWELPNGWVSWLVSTFAVGGLLVLAMLYPLLLKDDNRMTRFLSRRIGLIVLPLLLLMSVGIVRRISDYGISIHRLYLILFNLWLYGIYIFVYINRLHSIRWILISPAILFLFFSVGPWRFSNITKIYLSNKIENILNNNKLNYSSENPVIADLDLESARALEDALDYLADRYGHDVLRPYFTDTVSSNWGEADELDISSLFYKYHNARYGTDSERNVNLYFDNSYDTCAIDVNGYRRFRYLTTDSNSTSVSHTGTEDSLVIYAEDRIRFAIPMQAVLDVAKTQEDPTADNPAPIIRNARYMLLITHFAGGYYPDRKTEANFVHSIEGFLFYK